MPKKRLKLCTIIWLDIESQPGWGDLEEYTKADFPTFRTTGYIVAETADRYILASTIDHTDPDNAEKSGDFHKIPKCVVLEIIEIP